MLLIFIPLGVAIAISPNNGDSNPVIYGYILEWDARLERELTIEIPRVLLWFIGFRTPSNENPSGRIPIRLGPGRSPAPVQQTRGNVILRRRTVSPGGHAENAMARIEVTTVGAPSPITSSSNSDCVDSR